MGYLYGKRKFLFVNILLYWINKNWNIRWIRDLDFIFLFFLFIKNIKFEWLFGCLLLILLLEGVIVVFIFVDDDDLFLLCDLLIGNFIILVKFFGDLFLIMVFKVLG